MNIEGTLCRLRAPESGDLDAMYGWENDTDVWRASGTTAPFSRHILSRLIDEQQFDIYATRQLRLVIETRPEIDVLRLGPDDCGRCNGKADDSATADNGVGACAAEAVGAVDLFEFDPQNLRAGVGILVAAPYRRQGYAADALLATERYVREVLHLHQLWCGIADDNMASLRLFRRAGYMQCGVRRHWLLTPDGWRNEILMQKIL